jgi:CRISPR-associated protein Cmr2
MKTARFVAEDCFKGKLVYAGGDDVLAFVCVDDLLPAMTLLRCLYSGRAVPAWLAARLDDRARRRFDSANGWLRLDEDLLLTMGEKATASCGAVVAHHQAPLGLVLRTLREAEAASKSRGGRDAFSLRVLKRAGGEVEVTDRWFRDDGGAAGLLDALMRMLAREGVSRRAAYHSVEWLAQLPENPAADLLRESLAYQFARQGGERELAFRLADYAARHHPGAAPRVLTDFLLTAEFLARNSRHAEESP